MGSRSLRARVLLWYTALLAVVIAVFGATVCLLAWRIRIAEVDDGLDARARALAVALESAPDGTFDLTLPSRTAPMGATPTESSYHVLWTASGTMIDRSDPSLDVPRPAAPGRRTRDGSREVTVAAPSGPLVLVGRDLTDVGAEVWALAGRLATVGLGALLVGLAGGWLLVGRALAPVARINRTAEAMRAGDFGARIPLARVETELGQVALGLNEAFDKLHAALERQRTFTADASHELRTPLTTLSTELQWALGRDRTPEAYRQSLEVCHRSVDRMTAIVQRLLALARADTAADPRDVVAVRLHDLVAQVVADLEPMATGRRVSTVANTAPVAVPGEPGRLREALTNVVVNAVQYSNEGGVVRVSVRESHGLASVTVADTGIGIAAGDLGRVFEPFFRADAARDREAGGAGLGLSVTQAVVRAHGGRVACTSPPGGGTQLTIHLPTDAARPLPEPASTAGG